MHFINSHTSACIHNVSLRQQIHSTFILLMCTDHILYPQTMMKKPRLAIVKSLCDTHTYSPNRTHKHWRSATTPLCVGPRENAHRLCCFAVRQSFVCVRHATCAALTWSHRFFVVFGGHWPVQRVKSQHSAGVWECVVFVRLWRGVFILYRFQRAPRARIAIANNVWIFIGNRNVSVCIKYDVAIAAVYIVWLPQHTKKLSEDRKGARTRFLW